MTEDEMVGWHHGCDVHGFEEAPGVGDGQGSLACCSPWGCRVGYDHVIELNCRDKTYTYKTPYTFEATH